MDGDALERLVGLLGAPEAPVRAIDWDRLSARIGTPVPVDYQRLCERWGRVRIEGRLNVEAPADDDRSGLVGFVRWKLAVDRDLRDDGAWHGALWPEPGGLLPWAWLGTTVWWQTAGRPDTWTVVLMPMTSTKDRGEITQTGLRSTAFVAPGSSARHIGLRRRSRRSRDRPRWLGFGSADEVDMGEERDGARWRVFLDPGDVLGQSRPTALDGFLRDLQAQRPRLREAIVDTRVRHGREDVVVDGRWRGRRRCRLIRAETRRHPDPPGSGFGGQPAR